MELNEQSAIERNMQDILSAQSAREEAEILAAIQSESEMADISDVDNGYRKITRTFFSAAHATKDANEDRNNELAKEESEERTRDIFQSMVQDLIERNREFHEQIYQGIQKNLDSARRELAHHEELLEEIQEDKEEQLAIVAALNEEEENAAINVQVVEEIAQERKVELEQAKALEATCSVAANAETCKTELGIEGATDEELQDRLSDGVTAAKVELQEVQELKQIANDNQVQVQQKKEAAEAKLQEVQQVESAVINDISRTRTRVMSLEIKMESVRKKIDEFNRNLEADVKSGKITPEEAAKRSAEFNDGLRAQASADPSKPQPVVAANTDIPNASRPTASAASSLNDGGGIKGGSISNQFASAASGPATPATPAMTPEERQPVYATSAPAMAMG